MIGLQKFMSWLKLPIMANHTGFTHIAFEVEDVETALNIALSHGAELLGEVTEKKIADYNGFGEIMPQSGNVI